MPAHAGPWNLFRSYWWSFPSNLVDFLGIEWFWFNAGTHILDHDTPTHSWGNQPNLPQPGHVQIRPGEGVKQRMFMQEHDFIDITNWIAQNSMVQVFWKLFLLLPVYSCYFICSCNYLTPSCNYLTPTCDYLTPSIEVETKQLLKLLLPIYKRIRSSKTTAYFENKLGRDDKKLVFIIRKHL